MRQLSPRKNANETEEIQTVPILVVKRIREAILDEVFKPGDHLGEVELAEKFEVSRSPVREALLALEKVCEEVNALKTKLSEEISQRRFIESLYHKQGAEFIVERGARLRVEEVLALCKQELAIPQDKKRRVQGALHPLSSDSPTKVDCSKQA